MNTSKRPLSGYRVVDFGQYIAGPAVAMMLADQGAEVIHIDPLGGPRWQSPANAILHRGKQCITLDLKQEDGLATAKALIASADVVIENFRPGVMNRLGLGAEAMTQHNPSLVYLALPGFSQQDLDFAETPAFEGIIAAAVGQFTDMGLNRILMGINPSFSPLPLASAYASVLGATAVTLALFARQTSGRGDAIEVPISAALMEGLAYNSMFVENLPDRYKSPRELEIERRRAHNEPLNLNYPDLQEFLDPFYRTYTCKDGRPFYAVCSSHTRHPIACLEVLGIWEEIEAAGIPTHSAYLDIADWPEGTECTLVSYPLSRKWADFVSEKMKTAFLQKTAMEWQHTFGEAGVPGCAHQLTREWLHSDHAQQSASILTVEDPTYGAMLQLGNICWLKHDHAVVDKTAASPLDDQGLTSLIQRWQTEAGTQQDSKVSTPRSESGWLDGIKILDLTNVIAGPTIAATLSRFGAEVISIDHPIPALDPWNTTVFGMQANQGKQSALLDLKRDAGQVALKRLLNEVDVITINATDAQLERLQLTEADIQQINPDLILCQFDAYSGPLSGPRNNHPGYDDLVQATTGIMSRFGGGMETPEEHAHFGTIDVLGGYCAALAIGVALVQRAENGGSVARSSLTAAGQFIQTPFMYDYPARAPFNEPSGRYVKGEHALYRCYAASDGWFFLAVLDEPRRVALEAAIQQPCDRADNDALEAQLTALFAQQTIAHWQALLSPADIPCQPLRTMSQWREEQCMVRGKDVDLKGASSIAFVRDEEHPCGHRVDLIAPNAIRPAHAAVTLPNPMPKYGEHTVAVLQSLGFTQTEIDQMIEEGSAGTQWAERYLPD